MSTAPTVLVDANAEVRTKIETLSSKFGHEVDTFSIVAGVVSSALFNSFTASEYAIASEVILRVHGGSDLAKLVSTATFEQFMDDTYWSQPGSTHMPVEMKKNHAMIRRYVKYYGVINDVVGVVEGDSRITKANARRKTLNDVKLSGDLDAHMKKYANTGMKPDEIKRLWCRLNFNR